MRLDRTKNITLIALLISLMLVLTFVPNTGYLAIGSVSITTIGIVVITIGFLFGFRAGLSMGILFGLTSIFLSYIRASTPGDILFQDWRLSILPRVIWGFFVGTIGVMLGRIKLTKTMTTILIAFLAGLLSLIHTGLIILAILCFKEFSLVTQILSFSLLVNSLVECGLAVIICPSIYRGIKKYLDAKEVKVW